MGAGPVWAAGPGWVADMAEPRPCTGLGSADFVEVAGIEPASFSTSPGLLRAQLALLFSAPAITQARRRQAQPLLDVPPSPAAGSGGGSFSLMPDTGSKASPG